MSERITELESQLQAWERWSRHRTLLLVLVPVLMAAALAYVGQARLARIERALDEGLAGLSAEPSLSATLEQDLARLPGLVAELKSLRPLPAQLMAERGVRSRAEADLARLREEASSLIGERDRLATALETTKAELARAQAERAESEQRLRELERTRETGQVALPEAASPAPAPAPWTTSTAVPSPAPSIGSPTRRSRFCRARPCAGLPSCGICPVGNVSGHCAVSPSSPGPRPARTGSRACAPSSSPSSTGRAIQPSSIILAPR